MSKFCLLLSSTFTSFSTFSLECRIQALARQLWLTTMRLFHVKKHNSVSSKLKELFYKNLLVPRLEHQVVHAYFAVSKYICTCARYLKRNKFTSKIAD